MDRKLVIEIAMDDPLFQASETVTQKQVILNAIEHLFTDDGPFDMLLDGQAVTMSINQVVAVSIRDVQTGVLSSEMASMMMFHDMDDGNISVDDHGNCGKLFEHCAEIIEPESPNPGIKITTPTGIIGCSMLYRLIMNIEDHWHLSHREKTDDEEPA